MSFHPQRPKITVEDLLHLKRAERPTAEFWSGFERELRQRQLAALVERQPRWQAWARFLAHHAYLPIGAAAAVAFMWVSVRQHAPLSGLPQQVQAEVAVVAAPELPAPVVSVAPSQMPVPAVERSNIDDRTAVAAPTALSERLPEDTTQLTPWSGAPVPSETPSFRTIAATLATLEQVQPELTQGVRGGRLPVGSELKEPFTRTAELATVAAVASKRGRLLAQFNDRHFLPEPQAPELVRERLTRRMADDDSSAHIRRVDLQGDRVLVKF